MNDGGFGLSFPSAQTSREHRRHVCEMADIAGVPRCRCRTLDNLNRGCGNPLVRAPTLKCSGLDFDCLDQSLGDDDLTLRNGQEVFERVLGQLRHAVLVIVMGEASRPTHRPRSKHPSALWMLHIDDVTERR